MVFDDGERRGLESWQLELVEDLFLEEYRRHLWVVPEGNGKSTLTSVVALYGADFSESPWIRHRRVPHPHDPHPRPDVHRAWWLPRWLDRIFANVDIEGASLD